MATSGVSATTQTGDTNPQKVRLQGTPQQKVAGLPVLARKVGAGADRAESSAGAMEFLLRLRGAVLPTPSPRGRAAARPGRRSVRGRADLGGQSRPRPPRGRRVELVADELAAQPLA